MYVSRSQRPASRALRYLTGLLFSACLALVSPAALAGIYQCRDASGGLVFTDRACPDQVVGAVVAVPAANVDYGYDRRAQAKVRARAEHQAHVFRSRWQSHNAQMERKADQPEERRIRQYKSQRDNIAKPTSRRKYTSPYSVHRGY